MELPKSFSGKERFYRWTGNTVQFLPANVSRIRPALIDV